MENNNSTPPALPTPQKSNGCGIASICVGWLIPIAGVILAGIALGRGEPNKVIAKTGLWISIAMWIVNILILVASNS